MQQPAVALLVAAVRSALAAETGRADRVAPVTTPAEPREVGDELEGVIVQHRVLPLIAPAAGQLGFAPDVADRLADLKRQHAMEAMTTVAAAARVAAAVEGVGAPYLMLKGPALAMQTTGSAVARGSGDVDLLVPAERVLVVIGALKGVGMVADRLSVPTPDAPAFGAVVRSQKAITLWGPDLEVDLHWRLDHARSCLTWSLDELLASSETVALGGVDVPTLGRGHAAIYNASHGGSDSWSHLRALVDQVRLQQGQDLAALRAEAYRVGAGRRWDLAQVMVARLMEDPQPEVPRSVVAVADAMWRWLLAGEGPRERSNARASLRGFGASIATLDTPRAAVQRAETVVWPVGAVADQALGDVGDRHPWLYPLATPYFLPKRLAERWRAGGRPRR